MVLAAGHAVRGWRSRKIARSFFGLQCGCARRSAKLAGGIAHDFNNQLTAILGFTDLLLETADDESTGTTELSAEDARQHPSMRPGHYRVLAVEDSGHGMDEATKARIFEPFFTTKGEGRDTGLGLAMVYGIMQQMNGFIWVYSEVGRGTTFRLYFPVTTAAAQPASSVPRRGTARTATVLVLEDDRGVRELVTRTLLANGYAVHAASNGEEAIRAIRAMAAPPGLVIVDMVLEGASGPEVIRQLQLEGKRVLFMSGYSATPMRDQKLSGPLALLEKPFTARELLSAVAETLANEPPNGKAD